MCFSLLKSSLNADKNQHFDICNRENIVSIAITSVVCQIVYCFGKNADDDDDPLDFCVFGLLSSPHKPQFSEYKTTESFTLAAGFLCSALTQ